MLKQKMPLTHALMWIVGSCYLITGGTYFFMQQASSPCKDRNEKTIAYIIQTGPQKQALPTEYLAELMGLSFDQRLDLRSWDEQKGRQRLLSSPLIASAQVAKRYNDSVFVDYTVRQPIASVYDIENTAIDKEGFLIPLYPFFSPKNLPEFYFGFCSSHDNVLSCPSWNQPVKTEAALLAFDIFYLLKPYHNDLFTVKRVDVSQLQQQSLGQQEIVVILQYEKNGADHPIYHYVRLTPASYHKELGNYLEFAKAEPLRLDEEVKGAKVIDMRIDQLAFVSDMP
jgi:hypothetical protein